MERKFVEKEGSYSYSEVRACTWFYTGIVNERQLFPLCRQDIPSIMIPSEFFVLFEVQTSEEEIITRLGDCGIAEEVIDEIGMPMPSKSRGRPRAYDWKQILAVLLCKGVSPFSDLEGELRDTGYCKIG